MQTIMKDEKMNSLPSMELGQLYFYEAKGSHKRSNQSHDDSKMAKPSLEVKR